MMLIEPIELISLKLAGVGFQIIYHRGPRVMIADISFLLWKRTWMKTWPRV